MQLDFRTLDYSGTSRTDRNKETGAGMTHYPNERVMLAIDLACFDGYQLFRRRYTHEFL